MKRIFCITLLVLFALVGSLLSGCSMIGNNPVFKKSVDINRAEDEVVVGKTTVREVIDKFGEPYQNAVSNKGNGFLLYTSMEFFGGNAQSYKFEFKKGRVSKHGIVDYSNLGSKR